MAKPTKPQNEIIPEAADAQPQAEAAAPKPGRIIVKREFRDEVVGFNNSGAPLGQRDDLHILAEMALTANPGLKVFFDELPTLEELQAQKTKAFLEKTK